MSEHECQCGRPTAGAWLCPGCIKTLDVAFGNISAYHADLETLRTKQTRYGSAATKGSVGKTQPLGMDLRFTKAEVGSEVDHDTRNTVVAWCRTVMEDQPQTNGPACPSCLHVSCHRIRRCRNPRNTVQSMCAYLQRQLSYVVRERWAEELLDEMLDLERRLARLIDRPADRWYAGKCWVTDEDGRACEQELYAPTGQRVITCAACGIEHDVAERRAALLAEAKEYNVTATEAANALIAWTDYDGSTVKLVDLIRKWRDHPTLPLEVQDVTSLSGKDRHLYRLGDIQDRLVVHAQRQQARHLRSA